MRVIKAINNNVVSCTDDAGVEMIAMGRGLGYRAKAGALLAEDEPEKVFRMESQSETDRLKNLLASLPPEQIELCTRIIAYATESLNKPLSPSVYLTLTDHVCFAITRKRRGVVFHNAMLTEVRIFYPREFAVGKYALRLIEQNLSVSFPEDEAANIALHLVNAEYDNSISETMHITQALHDILEIINGHTELQVEPGSLFYDELTVHLKFLVIRVFNGEPEARREEAFVDAIRTSFAPEYACAAEAAEYLERQSHHEVSPEKQAYLAMHIRRAERAASLNDRGPARPGKEEDDGDPA